MSAGSQIFIAIPYGSGSALPGPYPQYGWDFLEEFRKKYRKDSVSWVFPLESTAGIPQTYSSRHLRLSEHFQSSLPPVRLGTPLFGKLEKVHDQENLT